MPDTRAAVAHQFDDPVQQYESSYLGMWIFLVTEILFFGGLFIGYTALRYMYADSFAEASTHLSVVLGSVNTAILIGSSLTMVLAVHSAQADDAKGLVRFLLFTIFLGLAFLAIKGIEYGHKFTEHLVPGPMFAYEGLQADHAELFFSLYFLMTGLHAAHMVIGVGILGVLTILAWRKHFSSVYYTPVDITGLYWHFVDIVWIFLFPLLYLIGRH